MKPNIKPIRRRDFLSGLGVAAGAAAVVGSAGMSAAPQSAEAATPPKGKIPDKPYKTGHITFLTGPAAMLAECSLKGHILAAEEINAQGGLLGKRKIETLQVDEAAGTDAMVKETRRLKLVEGIDFLTGVISGGNTPAVGPAAEEVELLTMFTDGCTDYLFDVAIPNPKYVFRITNILSADGITAAVGVAGAWPEVRRIAHIHPDYAYGRFSFEHFNLAIERLLPDTEVVSEGWPKLGTTDFTSHITKIISAKPDLLVTSVWGGDYISFYKQGLRVGLFDKMKLAGTATYGVTPHTLGKDHPEGAIAGVHSNFYFTFPAGDRWPLHKKFVQSYYKRWGEFPAYEAEGGYAGLHMLRLAVEKANRLGGGGWPDDEEIIAALEGQGLDAPAGYTYIRPDNHQGYKDAVTGFSKNLPDYDFSTWDPDRVTTIPIRNITAPPNWPKPGTTHNEMSACANWLKETWPKMTG